MAQALQAPIAPFFRFPYLRPSAAAMDYLKTRNVASFTIDVDFRDFRTRDGDAVKRTVLAQLAGARKGILLFHDIQPSTAHALAGILDELKQRGFKVVHLVPKETATTLPEYDAQADRLIAHRSLAAAKEPLASRAVTWSQTGGDPAARCCRGPTPPSHPAPNLNSRPPPKLQTKSRPCHGTSSG